MTIALAVAIFGIRGVTFRIIRIVIAVVTNYIWAFQLVISVIKAHN